MISSKPGYSQTPVGKLEEFALNKSTAIRAYFGNELVMKENDRFDRLFFAIVAPSMEGKTQAAFTFKNLRPLYFVLTELKLGEYESIQPIYKNFINLSKKLKELAEVDLSNILRASSNNDTSLSIFLQVSTSELFDKHYKFKFLSLGFIVALIEDANSNYDANQSSWMKFFATFPRNLEFFALSFEDVQNFRFSPYMIFFDEFRGEGWSVLIRNMLRAINLPIFVANTNTDVAKFADRQQSNFSRVESDFAWSLAAVRLKLEGQSTLDAIDNEFMQITEAISRKSGAESELVYKFLTEFMMHQFNHLRPGFAELIFSSLKSVALMENIDITPNLNFVLVNIINTLAIDLGNKKPKMCSRLEGILGTLSLFMDNSYLSTDIADDSKMYHLKSYLQYHFYYLINPVNDGQWCFLTYPPAAPAEPDSNNEHLRFVTYNRAIGLKFISDWLVEKTYFKEAEVLAFLAIQSIFSSKSITGVLETGYQISQTDSNSMGTFGNTSQNIPKSDKLLEIIATICIIEATQHDFGTRYSTFSGQNGFTFINNLVENLIRADGFRRQNKVQVDLEITKNFLDSIQIPFLFPSGMELPKFFAENLSDAAGFNTRTVNFGRYGSSSNSKQIDGFFHYFKKNQDGSVSLGNCSVECKNWTRNLPAKELLLIMENATLNSAEFSLIVCNSLEDPTDETKTYFIDQCAGKNFNVFKLFKTSSEFKSFELISYFPQFDVILNNAAITYIILELDTINS